MVVLTLLMMVSTHRSYSFPCKEVRQLIFCYSKRELSAKVNSLQYQLQESEKIAVKGKRGKGELSRRASLYWLYIELIDRLGKNNINSIKRVSETLEALEQQRSSVLNELKPLRPKICDYWDNFQQFFQFISQTEEKKDYIRLEKSLNTIVNNFLTSAAYKTEKKIILGIIDEEIKNNVKNISRSKLRMIYKIQKLIIASFQNSDREILGDKISIKDDKNQFYNLGVENDKKLQSMLEMREQQIQMLRQNNYA
ncbi:MAG: hypothetical protein F6K08_21420, partial [Okeania sp. SIO1H6]|nr:hypothetical protein [Okeania sp. SIO1H6]